MSEIFLTAECPYDPRARYSRKRLLQDGARFVGGTYCIHICALNGDFGTIWVFWRKGRKWQVCGVGRARYADAPVKRAFGIPSLQGGRKA